MTLTELNNLIKIGDRVIFTETPTIDYNDYIEIEEGIEYHIVYYYTGEYELINNTYIHHYKENKHINTYQITLSEEDAEELQLMCKNYKEVF